MLIDVSRLDEAVVDAGRMTQPRSSGPGKVGSELAAELDKRELFFPAGHCEGICLGGYLLQGGYGWNSRVLGACVRKRDPASTSSPPTADNCHTATPGADLTGRRAAAGRVLRRGDSIPPASARAARVRAAVCTHLPVDVVDEVFTWAREASAAIDDRVELQIITSTNLPALGAKPSDIVVASPVFADDEETASNALSVFGNCPVADRAIVKRCPMRKRIWLVRRGHEQLPDRGTATWRTTCGQAPRRRTAARHPPRIIDTMPPPPSHFLMYNWSPSPTRAHKFYRLEDRINMYTRSGDDPADDERYSDGPAPAHGGDGPTSRRCWPCRREPGSTPGPLRHRPEHGPPRRGAGRTTTGAASMPGWAECDCPVPSLSDGMATAPRSSAGRSGGWR